MSRTTKALTVSAGLLVTAVVGCTDPTVAPKSDVTSSNVFLDPASYRAFLAKIYGGLIVTGQQGPSGNPDIETIDEGFGEYLRLYWYLQEMPTDEAVIGWNDPGLRVLNTGTWGQGNEMVYAMYHRVFYQVMLANEFLRQTTDAKLDARGHTASALRADVRTYRAEARFLRALSYWHGIDLFGNIPLVTEHDPLGSTPPAQATRQQLYDYVVSELVAITDSLPPRSAATYARATPAAAHMLLAKLYLNAGVYTGTPNYAGALTEVSAVITAGDSLASNFLHNFQADNHTSPEIILVAAQDGRNTQTWGGMTFLIHAGCGGSMSAAAYGIDYCWGGYRMKQQTYNRFGAGDGRASFFWMSGQQVNVDDIGTFSHGIAAPKFSNITSTGGQGSQTGMVDTDFPIFRLADAYLIYAEANLRGGGGNATTALNYVNDLRVRAYEDSTGVIAAPALTLDFILDERGRELMFEAHRRTDLIRFGLFSSGTYLWAWKNGVIGGAALQTGRDLYPIPANELIANPNLRQNPGY
jgi:hypothetical protein